HEQVTVNGSTTFVAPGALATPVTGVGGLFALGSNIGRRSHDRYAVVPEVGLKAGYNVTDNVRGVVGYNFLYMSSVVRPADQIDLRVNPNLQPTIFPVPNLNPVANNVALATQPPRPLFRTTDFWAQGVNFGVEIRY